MSDKENNDDALASAWLSYANKHTSGAEQGAFCAGFRAGLAHARSWRPLTEDPKTWPAEGQRVVVKSATGERVTWFGPGARWKDDTHWLPLPEPPRGESNV